MENTLLITHNTTQAQKTCFDKKLKSIEQQYVQWFKMRPGIFGRQRRDSLKYHTFSEQYGGTFSFIFWKNSELPDIIKNECIIAFEEAFGNRALAL